MALDVGPRLAFRFIWINRFKAFAHCGLLVVRSPKFTLEEDIGQHGIYKPSSEVHGK